MAFPSVVGAKCSRRGFLMLTSLLLPKLVRGDSQLPRVGSLPGTDLPSSLYGSLRTFIPPLFCTAYINPTVTGQAGQEAIVAKYPLSLVPQDIRAPFKRWRDKVKTLNPTQVMLGYLSVNNEVFVPGPGHDAINKARGEWARWPTGHIPTAYNPPRRLFDLRSPKWRESFMEACRVTLASYPYDGLYLDNCSVFRITHPLPSVRSEMLASLQKALLQLRAEFPRTLLVGNTRHDFKGLNGEMNENRIGEMGGEMGDFPGHHSPRMELHQTLLKNANDVETVEKEMRETFRYGGFFSAAMNYQQVLWFDIFDEVVTKYRESTK